MSQNFWVLLFISLKTKNPWLSLKGTNRQPSYGVQADENIIVIDQGYSTDVDHQTSFCLQTVYPTTLSLFL